MVNKNVSQIFGFLLDVPIMSLSDSSWKCVSSSAAWIFLDTNGSFDIISAKEGAESMKDLEQILTWSDDIYRFAMLVMDHMKRPRDYGTGEVLNMVEIHTISMIAKEPGICVSDIARQWNRTLGAASRNVERLQAKGYVEKRKTDDDGKTVHLYVTERGKRLAEQHHAYDLRIACKFYDLIKSKYSSQDIELFRAILDTLHEFYESAD